MAQHMKIYQCNTPFKTTKDKATGSSQLTEKMHLTRATPFHDENTQQMHIEGDFKHNESYM